MNFDNISLAINGQQNHNRDLEDYNLFDKLRREGKSLQDIVKQAEEAEALRKQVDEMDKRKPKMDAAVFVLMEERVRDDPDVQVARRKLLDLRATIISEICLKDPRYIEEYESYRNVVQERYVHSQERIVKEVPPESEEQTELEG